MNDKTDFIINTTNATGASCSGIMALYGFFANIDPATLLGSIGLIISAIVNFYFNYRKNKREEKKQEDDNNFRQKEFELKKIEIERKLNIELEIKNREFELLKKQNEELKNAIINMEFEKTETGIKE